MSEALWEAIVFALLALAAALYALGAWRLWRSAGIGRGIARSQAASYAGGWLAILVALVPPLDSLAGELFAAHMLQHQLMMLVGAPLLVLGRPLACLAWALGAARRSLQRLIHASSVRRAWRALNRPLAAWALHAVVIWAWHTPLLFNAALDSASLHALQHASFLASALLLWRVVMACDAGTSLLCLFTSALHTGALGALLTFSGRPWYSLAALEDQQLGGLLMWVPGGLAYLAAALAIAARALQCRDADRAGAIGASTRGALKSGTG